ncbi:uncharacterized protein LOC133889615 [Phragmites australis]|uniref:uncharacterized protein LOC133889615 n=1 Tax=Phragmites australis TaxID=29695 RepID=UPI002D789636|nr:uncharacterized protein LOC133889615 [Phragmites australis]
MPLTSIDRTVPWADLPPELCGLVVDRLDAFSVLCFPAVCKSWAAACKETPRLLRSGAPTLLTSGLDGYGYRYRINDIKTGTFGLHDVSTGKSFRGEAEGLRCKCWVGGKDDWLVTMDTRFNLELVNPVTGDRIRLPSFNTIPGAEVDKLDLLVEPRSVYRFQQVILCQTPAHRNGYLAVARFSYAFLAFTAAGDECWTTLENHIEGYMIYKDAIFHKGKLFAVSRYGRIYVWDMDSETKDPAVVRAPEIQLTHLRGRYRFNLAPSSSGQLLLVLTYGGRISGKDITRLIYTEQLNFDAYGILLHELDTDIGAWRRVSDLGGDHALFLGASVGASYPFYVSVPRGSKYLKANCVYVADMSGYDAVVFNLEQGSVCGFEPLVYPVVGGPLQSPMWFRPTARLEGQMPVKQSGSKQTFNL